MDFEKSLKELESIVKQLEDSSSSLEQGIALFERGVGISKQCFKCLNESKTKIDAIKSDMDKLFSDGEGI